MEKRVLSGSVPSHFRGDSSRETASRANPARKYVRLKLVGRVAQLVEQRPFKAWVAGSIPAALTKISEELANLGRVDFGDPQTLRP